MYQVVAKCNEGRELVPRQLTLRSTGIGWVLFPPGYWDGLLKEAKSNLGMLVAEGRDSRNSMKCGKGGEAAK